MLHLVCSLRQHFQDLGHSFSLYRPPSWQITYISSQWKDHWCYCYMINSSFHSKSEIVWYFIHFGVYIQYCAKVTQAKCVNFILCSCDFSTKVRTKVRVKFHGVSSDNSLEQRAIFLQSFVKLKKIRQHKRKKKILWGFFNLNTRACSRIQVLFIPIPNYLHPSPLAVVY